jgi:hypothetical protein
MLLRQEQVTNTHFRDVKMIGAKKMSTLLPNDFTQTVKKQDESNFRDGPG